MKIVLGDVAGLPADVFSHVLLFLRVEFIKQKMELASRAFHQVANCKGMWFRLYFRDFLTSKSKSTKKPVASRKRRREGDANNIKSRPRRHHTQNVPDRAWDILYKVRYTKALHDARFVSESGEAQTAILDLELAESMIMGSDGDLNNRQTCVPDNDLESMLIDELAPQSPQAHVCGVCCKSAVPSKDQFGAFVCPFTGRMFEASTVKQVTDNWDDEYTPFAPEDSGLDEMGNREDNCEDWARPGVWGRCFSEGYNCVSELECDEMLCRYKRMGSATCDEMLCGYKRTATVGCGGDDYACANKLRKLVP